MKKLMFFAIAAMVALASCSKTELINTEAPKEIGFKAVTGSITKAEESDTFLDGNIKLGVFAYVNNTTDLYFGNTAFSKGEITTTEKDSEGNDKTITTSYWMGGKFWPLQSSLDFIVYAPYDGTNTGTEVSPVYNVNLNNKSLSVKVDNTNASSIENQTDYLYGAEYYKDFDKDDNSVPTVLKHALAKITVSLTASNVTINKVELVSPTMSGSYTVDYSVNNPTPTWTPATPTAGSSFDNFVFSTLESIQSTTATPATKTESIMVVPKTTATALIINYTLNGSLTPLTAKVNLNTSDDEDSPAMWAHGTQYTYNITINPQGIKFDVPTITDWGTGTGLDKTIN